SAIAVNMDNEIVLLDYGSSPDSKKPDLPIKVNPSRVSAVIVSHAHIDHSGAVPWLFISAYKPLVIATPVTLELSDLLIRDMIKLSGPKLPFGVPELQRMMSSSVPLKYNAPIRINEDCVATLLNAGHIPGSASILLKVKGKKIWYTGDINLSDAWLTRGADIVEDADIVIMETTYSYKDHPDRRTEERKLVKTVKKITKEQGGVCLIPAFSVGRSQEVLITLIAYGYDGTIILDGMSQAATNILLAHPELICNWQALKEASSRARWMRKTKERRKYIKKPVTIVAPAGMLLGGWSRWYLEKIFGDDKNGIIFVSYQIPGTLGHRVLNERKIYYDGKEVEVNAHVDYFDLTSHAGKSQLKHILKKLKSPEKIFFVHGEEEHCLRFAEEIREEFGFDVEVPNLGDVFKIA
ncbi:MAG: MBL fold metallo-hydrolase, partial [Candidatus Njordarchaeota archaeon]